LIPDKAEQATISADNPPWNFNDAFTSEDKLLAALRNNPQAQQLPERTRRVFHPKGTAYGAYSKKFIETIRNNRGAISTSNGSEAPEESPTHVMQMVWDSQAYQGAVSGFSQWWIFGYPSSDPPPDVCQRAGFVYADDNINPAAIPFPDGTFDFPFEVLGTKDCKYTGNADRPGQLSCPGFPNPVDCKEYPDQGKLFGTSYDPQGTDTFYNKVRCEW
jgi:hypothetical protein